MSTKFQTFVEDFLSSGEFGPIWPSREKRSTGTRVVWHQATDPTTRPETMTIPEALITAPCGANLATAEMPLKIRSTAEPILCPTCRDRGLLFPEAFEDEVARAVAGLKAAFVASSPRQTAQNLER